MVGSYGNSMFNLLRNCPMYLLSGWVREALRTVPGAAWSASGLYHQRRQWCFLSTRCSSRLSILTHMHPWDGRYCYSQFTEGV